MNAYGVNFVVFSLFVPSGKAGRHGRPRTVRPRVRGRGSRTLILRKWFTVRTSKHPRWKRYIPKHQQEYETSLSLRIRKDIVMERQIEEEPGEVTSQRARVIGKYKGAIILMGLYARSNTVATSDGPLRAVK